MEPNELIERVRAGESVYLNADCMDYLPHFPEGFFDCAVVDPPYGLKEDAKKAASRVRPTKKWKVPTAPKYTGVGWDDKPCDPEFFRALQKVSDHQIIWGANHFIENIDVKNSPCWIVWYKTGQTPNCDFADCELAYTTFKTAVKYFRFDWVGFGARNAGEVRIHPTQKPKSLYHWIAENYLKPDWLVLDTHVGSANSLAVYEALGIQYVGFEIDADYYRDSLKNIATYKAHFKSRSEEEIRRAGGQQSIFDSLP